MAEMREAPSTRSVRSFVAVLLPEEVRERLGQLQAALRPAASGAKWVEPKNLHLTLKFLGAVKEGRLDRVAEALDTVANDTAPFQLRCAGVGVFPNARRPRVLWAGTDDGHSALAGLAGRVEAGLEPLGFEREKRPFTGHVTLARLKSGAPDLVLALAAHTEEVYGTFSVGHVHLMESELGPRGPTYTVLQEFGLGEGK